MKDQSKTKQAKSKSKRRKVEQALKERAWTILENIQEGYYEVDLAGNYTFFNPSMYKILGYTEEEMMGMNYRRYVDKESAKKIFRDFNEVYRTGISSRVDYEQTKKDGSKMYVETSVALMRDSSGQPTGFRGLVRDITDRKRVEEALRESEKRYRELSDFLPISIFEIDAAGSVIAYNRTALEVFRYNQEDHIEGMNALQFFAPEEWQRVGENMGRVIQGTSIPGWEYTSLRKDGSTFIGLIYASPIIHENKIVGIIGAIIDITERKRAEEELLRTLESLRKAVGTTIQVMVSAVEIRDPYTAGHQIRSADLARAIATEMGLPREKIDGIRMAGSIHDIGKLSIPAEILSKPSKLTDLEFGIIKTHAQSGYDILKNIEFPSPIARMVLEHHERMDGSGYPKGMVAEETLLESRILAVADVVESMASHRPYRPSLGIDAALKEIENNKGTLYDTGVADACLRIFRENGYQLKGASF